MQNYFELLRIFCIAAESKNFKEAAGLLGKSPQAVTRAVQELEVIKGEILFYRSTRNSKITCAGNLLAQKSKILLNELEEVVKPSSLDEHGGLSGKVSLTLPSSIGRKIVMPAIIEFQRNYPDISISCLLSDSHSNVVNDKIDIGLRTGFITDNRFVARKVRDIKFYILGSNELIRKTGTINSIEDLANAHTIALEDPDTGRFWPWEFDNGRTFTPVNPRFVTDDLDTYSEALVGGLGLGQLADYLAKPLINAKKVQPVMTDFNSLTWGLYLYRPHNGPVPQRIRLLYDYLFNYLKDKC